AIVVVQVQEALIVETDLGQRADGNAVLIDADALDPVAGILGDTAGPAELAEAQLEAPARTVGLGDRQLPRRRLAGRRQRYRRGVHVTDPFERAAALAVILELHIEFAGRRGRVAGIEVGVGHAHRQAPAIRVRRIRRIELGPLQIEVALP